jgi:HD superfamily phosphohydrolase
LYEIRDPIHGFVELTEYEKAIVDSPSFQRLRNIKQLATTYLVYPGAEHTRFCHSIGVMHLVSRVFDEVIKKYKGPDLFSKTYTEYYRQILRIIALIHDIGHAPFSHASEELFQNERKHEDYTKDILFNTEMSERISELGVAFAKEHGREYSITPELIWLVYEGEDIFNDKYIFPDFAFLKSFVDGELDCDKMDYLLRDSYYCGVKYGNYDLDRLVSSFTIYRKPEENVLLLAIERGGIHALEEFILARYFMFIQVYFHKTRRFLDKRLVSAMKEVLPNGKFPLGAREYLEWDDTKVIQEFKRQAPIKKVVREFLDRKTMTCVYQTEVHVTQQEVKMFNLIRNMLDEKIKIRENLQDTEHLLTTDEIGKTVHYISAKLDEEKSIPVIIDYQSTPTTVYQESVVLKALRDPISIKRIYVDDKYKELAREIMSGCN